MARDVAIRTYRDIPYEAQFLASASEGDDMPFAVVAEPKNEFDPNALKVIAEDGHHLGYVGRDHQEMVRSWSHERWPYYCEAVIRAAHEDDGTTFYVGYLYIIKQ